MKIVKEPLIYSVKNNRGQYIIKCNKKVVGLTYSVKKAKMFIEEKLGRFLVPFSVDMKYSK